MFVNIFRNLVDYILLFLSPYNLRIFEYRLFLFFPLQFSSYVRIGKMHWLNTFDFRYCCISLFSLYLLILVLHMFFLFVQLSRLDLLQFSFWAMNLFPFSLTQIFCCPAFGFDFHCRKKLNKFTNEKVDFGTDVMNNNEFSNGNLDI